MSAFASLGKSPNVQDYCYPHPLPALLERLVDKSSFEFTIENSAFAPSSVFLALQPLQYLVIRGLYQLKVHRGICIINNAHQLACEEFYPIITSSAESLPTIAAPSTPDSQMQGPTKDLEIFPGYATVIEIKNWTIGIENLGSYMPSLAKLYKRLEARYTFEFLLEAEDTSSAIYFDEYTLRVLNNTCRNMEKVAVFGVPKSGKRTFAKALLNSTILCGKRPVAYLDLDPSSIDGNNPGCISLRVLRKPVLGEFFFWDYDEESSDQVHRYYGHSSFAERPSLYLQYCCELLNHYHKVFESKGIPLVVIYPSWIKGYGKEILVEFTKTLKPKKLIYLTHNNALALDSFQADVFEESDHPDIEVLSGFQVRDTTIVRGVRKDRALTKKELLFRNKLLYFHQTSPQEFDLITPLLHKAPVALSFDRVAAVSVLNLEAGGDLLRTEVYDLIEATMMAILVVKDLSSRPENFYIPRAEFDSLDATYIGLCMVHSVDTSERIFNLYLRDASYISDQILQAQANGHSIVLARGEGEIPAVEFTNGLSGEIKSLPYVSSERMQKLGGIWKVRRNIGRKNQG